MPTTPTPLVLLDDVLYELALTCSCPNAKTINDFVRRYPEHSREIVEFAAERALQAMRGGQSTDIEPCTTETSAAVARALIFFQHHLNATEVSSENEGP